MLYVSMALCIGGTPLPSRADSLDELMQRIEKLKSEVVQLEQRQPAVESAEASRSGITAPGAGQGSFQWPGTNTSVTVGGYVKVDAVFSNPSAGVNSSADLFLQPNAIPVGPGAGENEHNQFKLGARESRLFVKTTTPTAWGDLLTHVEGDFYGADGNESVSNSNGLRLRHAYAALGPLLGGQTWTNFMFVPALPETLDFGGPVGQIFVRQAQLRWTGHLGASAASPSAQWSIAVENPESVVTLPNGTSFRADDDRFPDMTGQVVWNRAGGKFAVSGLLRELRADSSSPAVIDQAWGGAVSAAGIVPTFGRDDVRFVASAGNAIGRYSNGLFPDAIVGADGQMHLPRQWGWYAAYRHFWRDTLRSNVALSGARENNPAGTPASANKSTESAHVNLIWSPVVDTDLGVEYIYANRRTEDGATGTLKRVQISAKYTF